MEEKIYCAYRDKEMTLSEIKKCYQELGHCKNTNGECGLLEEIADAESGSLSNNRASDLMDENDFYEIDDEDFN